MTTRAEFLAELTELAAELIPQICDDQCTLDELSGEPSEPCMEVTIGADQTGWAYQTGDNSFTGGAYGYAYWGVGMLYRNTKPELFAAHILDDLEQQAESEDVFFFNVE